MAAKCVACLANINTDEDDNMYINCCSCNALYHLQCVNIVNEERMPQELQISWLCPSCKNKLPKGDNSNTPIRMCTAPQPSQENRATRSKRKAKGSPKVDECTDSWITLTSEIRLLRSDMSELKSCVKTLTENVQQCTARLEVFESRIAETENRIQALENSSNAKITSLEQTVSQLQSEIETQNQVLMRNEIEIIGVNETANENLQHILLVTAQKIGCELRDDDIDWVNRSGGRHMHHTNNGNTKLPRPIVVRFLRKNKRNEFLRATKPRRNLHTTDIEVDGPSRKLYFNERLTKKNRLLFREARSQSHQAGFRFCWISNGVIRVRKHEGGTIFSIRNQKDLDNCFTSHNNSGST